MVNVKAPGVNEGRWISKYSDLKVEEMVLPDSIKNRIQSFLQIENNVYNTGEYKLIQSSNHIDSHNANKELLLVKSDASNFYKHT